jgi:hypothetical protein
MQFINKLTIIFTAKKWKLKIITDTFSAIKCNDETEKRRRRNGGISVNTVQQNIKSAKSSTEVSFTQKSYP